jgi:hypothetical protein
MGVSDNTDFMELSKEVTKDFLQTAVFVDEQAYFEKEEAVTELVTPTRSIQKEETDIPSAEISEEANHTLNAKEVIDVFASEGIVCSVIKPLKEEKITSGGMINAVKKADALILDWDIHSDEGETALDIINYIISCDIDSRLRLILIYSGEKLSEISKSVSESLGKIGFNNPDDFTFIKGHSRISIYAKTVGSDTSSDNSRTLEIEDIPNCLASELSQMTAGLISNVALKSMSVLRKNTHLILAKLGPEIDPPYLSHRCLLPHPEDAKGHIVDIIADELHYLLNNSEVTDFADLDSIKKWLNHVNRDKEYCIHHLEGNTQHKIDIDCSQIISLLEKGYDNTRIPIESKNSKGEKQHLNHKGFKQLSKTFDFTAGDFDKKDCQFAVITSQKSHYVEGSNTPILTQGSILKGIINGSSSKYWLCIQQKCNCVRLKKETEFSFVPLKNIEGNKGFDLVVQDQDSYIKLRIDYDNHESWLFKFKPASGEVVRAALDNAQFVFKTTDENKFHFISELKENHIQRISNNIATKLSRIGLDESEWQRRWASLD